jgi:hypothetical protein
MNENEKHYEMAFELQAIVCGDDADAFEEHEVRFADHGHYLEVRVEHELLDCNLRVYPERKLHIEYLRKTLCRKTYRVPSNILKNIVQADWFYKKYNLHKITAEATHAPEARLWGHYVFAREGFDATFPVVLGYDGILRSMRSYAEFDNPYLVHTTMRQLHDEAPLTVQRIVKSLGLPFWKKHGISMPVSLKVNP